MAKRKLFLWLIFWALITLGIFIGIFYTAFLAVTHGINAFQQFGKEIVRQNNDFMSQQPLLIGQNITEAKTKEMVDGLEKQWDIFIATHRADYKPGEKLKDRYYFYEQQKEELKKKGVNHLFLYYKDLDGLRTGDKVKLSGMDVGTVDIFGIDYQRNKKYIVLVKFDDKKFRVKKNSYFFINTLGIDNKKYIEICPNAEVVEYFEIGECIEGIDVLK